MLSYRLGTVNDFHWGFKPVLSYYMIANLTLSQQVAVTEFLVQLQLTIE